MELVQFPLSHPCDTLVFPAELTPEDSFGLLVTERPNHDSRILLHHVKRNTGGCALAPGGANGRGPDADLRAVISAFAGI